MQLDPKYLSSLTQSLSLSSGAEQTLTAQLSSGLRVGTLSDDPVAASTNVGLASQLAGLDSFVQSASGSEGLLQVTDSTLGEVVTQLTSAIGLATQAANGTLNASNQAAIATQVSAIRDGILGLANTSYQGSYLFSGSQGSTRPFSLDATTSPATTVYSGGPSDQQHRNPRRPAPRAQRSRQYHLQRGSRDAQPGLIRSPVGFHRWHHLRPPRSSAPRWER